MLLSPVLLSRLIQSLRNAAAATAVAEVVFMAVVVAGVSTAAEVEAFMVAVAAGVSTAAEAEAFMAAVEAAFTVAEAEASMVAAGITAAGGLLAEVVTTRAAAFAVNPGQVVSERAAIRTAGSVHRAG